MRSVGKWVVAWNWLGGQELAPRECILICCAIGSQVTLEARSYSDPMVFFLHSILQILSSGCDVVLESA